LNGRNGCIADTRLGARQRATTVVSGPAESALPTRVETGGHKPSGYSWTIGIRPPPPDAMSESNPLDALLRAGAQELIAEVVEAELAEFLEAWTSSA